MIPQRLKLAGFLSYRDEQEIRFDGSSLWMLSGHNGSGKSSIFDAITYALFGYHRGGGQNVAELINKDSTTLSVEFDFLVDRQLYRIRRTARRRANGLASTQQAFRKRPGSEDDWEAIPDTNLKTRFDAWVKDLIGLDYETFTSSVLLLQGKSEKLLNTSAAERAQVLARIVDLERYQKLHALADEKRKRLKGRQEEAAARLAAVREVSDEELAAADDRIAQARQTCEADQRAIDALIEHEAQARQWDETRRRLVAARARLGEAEKVLGHAAAIEKDYARLRELREVLPAVGIVLTERRRIADSERQTQQLTRQREEWAEKRRTVVTALDTDRRTRESLRKTLAEAEGRAIKLADRLRVLTLVLEQLRQAEDAQAEIDRLRADLNRLPPDPEAVVRELSAERDRLARLAEQVATLTRLHEDRCALIHLLAELKEARSREERLKEDGTATRAAVERLEAEARTARDRAAQAEQEAAAADALYHQARHAADALRQLGGDTTCRVCGQPLTEQHLAAEQKRRDLDATAARRKAEDRRTAAAKARTYADDLTQHEHEARERLNQLREEYRAVQAEVKRIGQEVERLRAACRHSYLALPEELKTRVCPDGEPADWTATTFPNRHDLARLSEEAKRIDTVKRRLQDAQAEAARARELRAKLESAEQRLRAVRLSLPPDPPDRLRQEFATCQSEEHAVRLTLEATKRALDAAEKTLDTRQRELAAIDQRLTELDGKLHSEDRSRHQSDEAIHQALRTLPESWRRALETAGLNDHLRWKEEYDRLVAAETEKKHADLQAARGSLETLRAEVARLERDEADFPPAARRPPDELRAELAAARRRFDQHEHDLRDALAARRELEHLRQQRDELRRQVAELDTQHARFKLLADLLGRDGLQRDLVRRAEGQIVDYANAVLDRLSGGKLFLRLVGGDDATTDKALELECWNRTTSDKPINVAFLSGSQRFRVAVALALGIGQYASKQHRPIESVIIDEGFGCLDRTGRQAMIQELQNLRGHLNCILLVSHQEEFAEAFPDGYRFELDEGGATRISRFSR